MSSMSFKRDSIDTSLLRNLKFRRVSEILAQQIPENEARLLSNGRLTCLVCLHRPIFDNINMLSVHRKGRRHISELSKYLLHKRELQLRQQKSCQLQELIVNSKNPGIKLNEERNVESKEYFEASFSNSNQKMHPLLSSLPYSSCSKKRNQKIPLAMQRKMVLETPKITPRSSALVIENSEASQYPSAHSEVRRYLKGLQRQKPLSKVVEKLKEGYSLPDSHQESAVIARKSVNKEGCASETKASSSYTNSPGNGKETIDKMQQASNLMMSGWIWKKDVDGGKWEKDPNAEFDSDDEDPQMTFS